MEALAQKMSLKYRKLDLDFFRFRVLFGFPERGDILWIEDDGSVDMLGFFGHARAGITWEIGND